MHNIGGWVRVSVSVCVCVCVCCVCVHACVYICVCVYVRDISRFNTPITLTHTHISSFCSNLNDADEWEYTDMGLCGVNFVHLCV